MLPTRMKSRSKSIAVVTLITLLLWGCAVTNQRDQTGPHPHVNVWKGLIDHGDKPGIGLILTESEGEITGGSFYVLDPDKPHNFKAAGQTAPLRDIQKATHDRSFTFKESPPTPTSWFFLIALSRGKYMQSSPRPVIRNPPNLCSFAKNESRVTELRI
jgi:hypothetical protein